MKLIDFHFYQMLQQWTFTMYLSKYLSFLTHCTLLDITNSNINNYLHYQIVILQSCPPISTHADEYIISP